MTGSPLKDYNQLVVWQRSIDLVETVYRCSKVFPAEEIYGLRNQIRRAAVSISSNIAEGQGRLHKGSFLNHISIAHGSLRELESQLEIAGRLGYIERRELESLNRMCSEVGKLLCGLFKSLKTP